jgi:hypothetical protein
LIGAGAVANKPLFLDTGKACERLRTKKKKMALARFDWRVWSVRTKRSGTYVLQHAVFWIACLLKGA